MCVSGLFLVYNRRQLVLDSKRVADILLSLTSCAPLGACGSNLDGWNGAAGDVPHESRHLTSNGSGYESLDMSGQPVQAFGGIALSWQHLLNLDLMRGMRGMRGMLDALALKPPVIPHRPWRGPVIDPQVAQHERRNQLAFVPLVLCGAFPGTNQVALRLLHLISNPDRRQFPGAQEPSQSNGIQSVCFTRSLVRTGSNDGATTQHVKPNARTCL